MLEMNRLQEMMAQGTGVEGRWIPVTEREPARPGTYTVIRRRKSGHYDYDTFIWRGMWLSLAGQPIKATEAWFERKEAGADG